MDAEFGLEGVLEEEFGANKKKVSTQSRAMQPMLIPLSLFSGVFLQTLA